MVSLVALGFILHFKRLMRVYINELLAAWKVGRLVVSLQIPMMVALY